MAIEFITSRCYKSHELAQVSLLWGNVAQVSDVAHGPLDLNVALQLFQYCFKICPICDGMYGYIVFLINVSFYLECNVHIIYLLQSVMVIHTVWSATRAVVNVVVVYSVIMWPEVAKTDALQECMEIDVIKVFWE